jgi:hypothetical protein
MRIVKIVALSTLVGPLIASIVVAIELLIVGLYQGGPVRFDEVPYFAWNVSTIAYVFGAPYGFLTSGVFALVAVLAGWRHLLVALLISLVPAALFIGVSVIDDLNWNRDGHLWVSAFLVIVVTTTVCWLLSRRWHSPNT